MTRKQFLLTILIISELLTLLAQWASGQMAEGFQILADMIGGFSL